MSKYIFVELKHVISCIIKMSYRYNYLKQFLFLKITWYRYLCVTLYIYLCYSNKLPDEYVAFYDIISLFDYVHNILYKFTDFTVTNEV